jgi:hypothetical protein
MKKIVYLSLIILFWLSSCISIARSESRLTQDVSKLTQDEINFFVIENEDFFYKNINTGKKLPNVTKYRTNKPESIVFKIPENIKENISVEPEEYIMQLIEFLISWTDDNYLKVKSIHDWICLNISYNYLYVSNETFLKH